ncbi:DUF6933 domain-containing protein [Enterococcus timonensis]|uniref:DUF6933 domain-containing protein n=1 Tax=Enterococcus timonensis TaxID=1852364 RepID=UPI0008DA9591|nr:hypothetical protein [Enterococcus timonensis]
MFINPTKKALSIFNQLPAVENIPQAQKIAAANPFFSWHANYFNVDRKKVVVLVNDLTYATVVLYDINAKNKKNLAEIMTEGIRVAFKLAGIPPVKIDKYFQEAGDFEISTGFNRQVSGVVTLMIQDRFPRTINSESRVQRVLMQSVQSQFFKHGQEHIFPKDELQKAIKERIVMVTPPLETEKDTTQKETSTYQIKKTWAPFQEVALPEDVDISDLSSAAYDKAGDKIEKNNELVLAEFENYLREGEQLSEKIITRHVDRAKWFINEYLMFDFLETPLAITQELDMFLADWYPRKAASSQADLRAAGSALKKFANFLYLADEISKEELADIKETIKDSVEYGMGFV